MGVRSHGRPQLGRFSGNISQRRDKSRSRHLPACAPPSRRTGRARIGLHDIDDIDDDHGQTTARGPGITVAHTPDGVIHANR